MIIRQRLAVIKTAQRQNLAKISNDNSGGKIEKHAEIAGCGEK